MIKLRFGYVRDSLTSLLKIEKTAQHINRAWQINEINWINDITASAQSGAQFTFQTLSLTKLVIIHIILMIET